MLTWFAGLPSAWTELFCAQAGVATLTWDWLGSENNKIMKLTNQKGVKYSFTTSWSYLDKHSIPASCWDCGWSVWDSWASSKMKMFVMCEIMKRAPNTRTGKCNFRLSTKAALHQFCITKSFTELTFTFTSFASYSFDRSAVSKDGGRVLLTACDMSSVHCLMQIFTAFFFIFWCLCFHLCNKWNAIKRQAFSQGPWVTAR